MASSPTISKRSSSKRRKAATGHPTFLDPERLYTFAGFIEASGISRTRVHQARQKNIKAPWLSVGRRKFLRGRDAIEFIERLAQNNHLFAAEQDGDEA